MGKKFIKWGLERKILPVRPDTAALILEMYKTISEKYQQNYRELCREHCISHEWRRKEAPGFVAVI